MINKLKNQRNILLLLILTSLTFHLIFGLEGQAQLEELKFDNRMLEAENRRLDIENEDYFVEVDILLRRIWEYERKLEELERQAVIYDIPLSEELQEFTFELCKEYEVNYELVLAVMAQESDYQEDIVSSTGDFGIMQINAVNHDWLSEALGINDFMDAKQNILAGVYILKDLSSRYENPHQVLMAYNHGEYGAKEKWEQGVTETTYSRGVIARKNELREE